MSNDSIQSLPGFREFFPAECAQRNYIFENWRRLGRRYGFVEYEGPVLEPTDLYRRKSGDEIVTQLFHFTDAGGREVALRPEVTPSLARMGVAKQREFKKPIKWFQIGPCFRYEKPQKGRGREFYQFNLDILGEASVAADADLIALSIDLLRDLGFAAGDFYVRLSDRRVWATFMERAGIPVEQTYDFLQVIDKLEREKPDALAAKLGALGTTPEAVRAFIAEDAAGHASLERVLADLTARGLADFVRVDLGIVRGLAYYTGTVFEVFDARGEMRAIAGGGRYDTLCELIGGSALAAVGFAMGDMVLGNFIQANAAAKARYEQWLAVSTGLDVYVVVADEQKRPEALALVQQLRSAGLSADYPYGAAKVGDQFKSAEYLSARAALIVGAEYPQVKLKNLAARTESVIRAADAVESIRSIPADPAAKVAGNVVPRR